MKKINCSVLILSLVFLSLIFSGCSKRPLEYQNVTAANGEIKIPVSNVNDGKVHFYTYKKNGKRINFFVRTDGTGKLSTYFDACFTCYKFKKGYHEEGASVVCNECQMKFRLADEYFDNSKGCSPIILYSVIDEKNITIKTDDIEKGGRLF